MGEIKIERPILLILNIFLFAGLIFFSFGLVMYSSYKNVDMSELGTTMATITNIDTYIEDDEKKHDVYITYSVDGTSYQGELNGYSSNMKVGKEVELLYELNDPSIMRFPFGEFMSAVLFACLGGFFVVFGLVGDIVTLKKMRYTKMLFKNGEQLKGVISEVILDRTIKINGRCPYRVIATTLNPKTNEILEAKSGMYKSNPSPYVEIGSEVIIYADVNKNKGLIKDVVFKDKSTKNWVSLGD